LFIPNAFTPNGDGANPLFGPTLIPDSSGEFRMGKYYFAIFDRWGNRIFETQDINKKWDGTINNIAADVGTYHYLIQLTCPGSTEATIYKGSLLLIK
jgi:gliding motility-associated-like protein